MKYIVVLDSRSIIGAVYLKGSNDGTDTSGSPILDCTQIEDAGPYLRCTRAMNQPAGSSQTVLVPHQAVAYCVGYAAQQDRPMGFSQ